MMLFSAAFAYCFARSAPRLLAATLLVFLAGCFGGDDDDDDPVATPIENPGTPGNPATTVQGKILVPSSQVASFATLKRGWPESVLLAAQSVIPVVHAVDDSEFAAVRADSLQIFRFSTAANDGAGGYLPLSLSAAQQESFNAAVVLNSDGTYAINLTALAAAGILPTAALDTSLKIQVTLSLVGGGSVTLGAPLIDENLNISPLTELLVRKLAVAGSKGLQSLSLGEARVMLQAAKNVVVESAGAKTIAELLAAAEEAVGAQLEEQLATYQAPEAEASRIASANGNYQFFVFGSGVAGSVDTALDFGEYIQFLEHIPMTVALNAQGEGTWSSASGGNGFYTAELVASHSSTSSSTISFFTQADEESDPVSLQASLTGDDVLVVTEPAAQEFDSDYWQWRVAGSSSFALRPVSVAGAAPARMGVARVTNNYFNDVSQQGSEGSHTSPDLNAPRFREMISALVVGFPVSSLSAADFDRDLGVVGFMVARSASGEAKFLAMNERLDVDPESPGSFSGGFHQSFAITRNLVAGGSGVAMVEEDQHSDAIALTLNDDGTFSLSSSDDDRVPIKGIAAPGGEIGALGLRRVVCGNGEQEVEYEEMLTCPQNTTMVSAALGLGIFVPLDQSSVLSTGDVYSFQGYEFTSQAGSENGVKGCRGLLTIEQGATGFVVSDERCVSINRPGSGEVAVPFLESQTSDGGSVEVTVIDGKLEGVESDSDLKGYVSPGGDTLVFRFANADDPTYVGLVVATRITQAVQP